MKPNFALSLSFDGIKLLHRAAGGWREVGEVNVTSPDLAAELAVLRRTAVSLDASGVRTKLIIPSAQIKYLTIETPGLSEAARRKAAEAALFDATPYEIEELAYDISLDGPLTHVAAVARETLAEAEGFALEHRFHPVSFVAIPDNAAFLGEPFFGTTDAAGALLDTGETVEADGVAVVVVGRIEEPAEEKPAMPEKSATATAEPTKDTPDTAPAPAAPAPVKAEDTPDVVAPPRSQEKAPAPKAPTPKADVTKAPPAKAVAPPSASSAKSPAPPAQADVTTAAPTNASARVAPEQAPKQGATGPDAAEDAPKKPTIVSMRKAGPAKPVADEPAKIAIGFSTRRSAPAVSPSLGGATRSPPAPDSSSLTGPPIAVEEDAAPAAPKTGFLSRRTPRKRAASPVSAASATNAGNEQERMTVFGARSDEVGGKPKFLGLIMTIILLVFLAGVAAWAAVFLDDGLASLLRGGNGRAVASAPENQAGTEIIRVPTDAQEETVQTGDPVEVAALDPVLSAEDSAVLDALQDPRPEPQRTVITEAEAAARYAVSGIWPLSPATALEQPDVPDAAAYRSSLDPVSAASDAIALPAPAGLNTDVQLAAVASPPPFGQPANLDSRGLWVPTPEGVVTPEGYTLVAASPPRKPPETLTRFARQPEAAPAVSPLAGFRPKTRPGGLAENAERSQLGGVTRVELAVFRPAVRPNSLQQRAAEARKAEEAAQASAEEAQQNRATAAAAAAAAAALALPPESAPVVDDATQYAVALSKRPDTRPRNFSRIVKRAQRAAPAETRVAAAAPSVAPKSVAPKIPSKASVARSATVKNAINLRKVNLIGVYGKPSSRRALVRLSNGRYKKVRVGDRIDGGKVSAIGDSDLRYTKGGRNVVLKIPSS